MSILADTAVDLLIACAWRSTLVLLVGAVCVYLARKQTAATRHWLWTLVTLACLLLPLVYATVERPRTIDAALAAFLPAAPHASQPMPGMRVTSPAHHEITRGSSPPPTQRGAVPAPLVFALWLTGSVLASLGMLRGAFRLRRLRAAATPANAEWQQTLEQACVEMSVRRVVRVRQVPGLASPLVWGICAPEILVPASCESWAIELRRATLLHELAHVRRNDLLTSLLARIACAGYWWQPLAWLAWRGMNREREHACDEAVLRHGVRASSYAQHLLSVAARPLAAAAPMAGSIRSHLEQRIRAILAPLPPAMHRTLAITVAIAMTSMLALLGPASASDRDAPFTQLVALRPLGVICDATSGRVRGVGPSTAPIFGWCGDTFALVTQGDIRFAGDLGHVQTMADDGYLLVETWDGNSFDRVELFGGKCALLWSRGVPVASSLSAAQRWLATHLARALTETPIAIEPRVTAWLEAGGAATALEHIAANPSSFVRAACLDELSRRVKLAPRESEVALRLTRELTDTFIAKDRIRAQITHEL